MNPTKLEKLLDDIESSGIADGLITKLSDELDIGEVTIKLTLRGAIHLLNGFSTN